MRVRGTRLSRRVSGRYHPLITSRGDLSRRCGRAVVAVAVVAALPLAGPSTAGAALTQGRAILVSERFTPERGAKDNPLAHTLVAQPGEREALQAIVRVPANVPRLHARVAPAVAGDPVLKASELALVGFVDVTRPSTAISRGAGSYADPLPPLGRTASRPGAAAGTASS